jgi:AcrR family transcriptional regulator
MGTGSAEAGVSSGLPFQDIGREQKRRFILKAAAAAFGAKGYHGVTIRDIVDRAGIAHGTFYLYFEGKDNVYRVLSQELHAQIMEAILPGGRAELRGDGPDLAALVHERLAALARLFEREADIARVFVHRAPGIDPDLEEQARRFTRDMIEAIAAVLRAGAERGVFRRHDPQVAALCLVGAIDRVIEGWLHASDAGAGPSLPEMMEEAAGFFVAALLTDESGPQSA